ncbi:22858_t:CDS:1, partial [Racocetra persica]
FSIEMKSTNGKKNININQRCCKICGLIGYNAPTCKDLEESYVFRIEETNYTEDISLN